MKKILIVSDSLRIGGIQSSLRCFLKELSTQDYSLDLFLFNNSGCENLNIKNVNVISGTKLLKIISYTASEAKQKGIFVYIIRKILALLCKILSSNVVYSFIFLFEKKIGYYDIAISYSNNISERSVYFGYNKFVLEKVDALHKISYIHADYNAIRSKITEKEYHKFDSIWCVSNFVKNTFVKYNPECISKCYVVYNFIDVDKIKKVEKNPYTNNKFHIVTVGRLDKNKSQIDAVNIALALKEKEIDFEWFFLGDGPEKKVIQDEIASNGLNDNMFLIGNKDNVSDYLAYSDVFVSLSKSESYGLAIAESLLLNTNTVVRDIPVADEIINDNGIICKNDDEIINTLCKFYNDSNYYNLYKSKSKLYFDNSNNLNYINKLFDMFNIKRNPYIGIATFHLAQNYGAVLQAYALNKHLGDCSELINFYSTCLYDDYSPYNFKRIEGNIIIRILKFIYFFHGDLMKKIRFDNFRRNYILSSKKLYNLKEVEQYCKKYKALITGSDQVWNDNITGYDKDFYFLNFRTLAKKYSYAASIGSSNISSASKKNLQKSIVNFEEITVREESAKEILESIDLDSKVVVDPTLLLSREEWDLVISSKKIKRDYIFVYCLEQNQNFIDIVNKVSEYYQLPIVHFGRRRLYKNVLKQFYSASPSEFLSLMKNSKYVVTNSFHGTVFSIIFHKQFISIPHSTRNTRQVTLLESLGLIDRLTTDIEILKKEYKEVEINKIRKKSTDIIERWKKNSEQD